MIPCKQQRLLLLIQLLTVWIFATLSYAQSLDDTSPFVVIAPDSILLCQTFDLSWPTNDTTTLYHVYLARGDGPILDENLLDPEIEIGLTTVVPCAVYVSTLMAGVGDVVRFRVQADDRQGINAVAWRSVSGNMCFRQNHGGTGSISDSDDSTITTKNTEAAETAANLGAPVTNESPNPTRAATSGPQAASQGPDPPSQLPATATPTNVGSNRGNDAPLGNSAGSSNVSDGSDPATSSGAQQGPGGGIEDQNPSHPSQTAVPNNSSGNIDTTTKQNSLSIQAVGIIAGTIIIAVFLCIIFMLWRWRRRKQPVAVRPRKSPAVESVRELLTPSSEESGFAQFPVMAEAPPFLQNPTQTLAVPPGPGGPRVPSYDEATGLYSPLNTPDPFRNVFGVVQYPGIIPSRPRNSLPLIR